VKDKEKPGFRWAGYECNLKSRGDYRVQVQRHRPMLPRTGLLFPRSPITSPTHKQKIEYG
jgi:hypothetical protein